MRKLSSSSSQFPKSLHVVVSSHRGSSAIRGVSRIPNPRANLKKLSVDGLVDVCLCRKEIKPVHIDVTAGVAARQPASNCEKHTQARTNECSIAQSTCREGERITISRADQQPIDQGVSSSGQTIRPSTMMKLTLKKIRKQSKCCLGLQLSPSRTSQLPSTQGRLLTVLFLLYE